MAFFAPSPASGRKREGDQNRIDCWRTSPYPLFRALISLNLDSARSNLSLKSHIASRISRKVADVLARSTCPNVKTLLLRRYLMIVGWKSYDWPGCLNRGRIWSERE